MSRTWEELREYLLAIFPVLSGGLRPDLISATPSKVRCTVLTDRPDCRHA